jgi:hypothetical protein
MLTKLLTVLVILMAGCLSHPPPVPVAAPLQEADPPAGGGTFAVDVNLTTFGDAQAGGIHFGLNPPNDTPIDWRGDEDCLFINAGGSRILHLNATARWEGGDRLTLFQWMKDDGQPGRDKNATTGVSPLVYVRDYPVPDGATWVTVGVQTADDLPVGFEWRNTTVVVHVELEYEGERQPRLEPIDGCAYSRQDVPP